MIYEDQMAAINLSLVGGGVGSFAIWLLSHIPRPENVSDGLLHLSIGMVGTAIVLACGVGAYRAAREGWRS